MDGLHMVVKRAAQCRNVYSATLPTVLRLLAVFSNISLLRVLRIQRYKTNRRSTLHYCISLHHPRAGRRSDPCRRSSERSLHDTEARVGQLDARRLRDRHRSASGDELHAVSTPNCRPTTPTTQTTHRPLHQHTRHVATAESRFLAVSLQVTSVTNPAVGRHYFQQLPSQPLRGLLPISLLGERKHNGCEQFA